MLLASVALLVVGIAWPMWYAYEAHQNWRSGAIKQVARDGGLIVLQPQLQKQLESLPASSLSAKLYPAANVSTAEKLLQTDVAVMLKEAGVWGQTVNQLPKSEIGELYRAGLRFSVSMTIDQLQKFVSKVEQHQRFLQVGLLDVTAPQIQARDQNAVLTVTMEVFGFGSIEPQPTLAPKSVVAPQPPLPVESLPSATANVWRR